MSEDPNVDIESRNRSPHRRRRGRRRRHGSSARLPRPSLHTGGSDTEDHAWHSAVYSAADGSHDECTLSGASASAVEGVSEPRSETTTSSEEDLESGCRDCRICKLRLERGGGESGASLDLGCSCKGDLGAAHSKCAQKWFQSRGNTTCEICGANAVNVEREHANETGSAAIPSTAPSAGVGIVAEGRSFWRGRRFMYILFACMLLAFIISWLFHFHVFS